MMLHLVTDRKRLVPDGDEQARADAVLAQARHAVEAGVDVIQIRELDLPGRSLAELTRAVAAVTRGSRTRVLVNDRLDVALVAGADGVHLKGASVTASAARRIVPPTFIVGRSVRDPNEAREAGSVNYLIAGTVWSTSSKPAGHMLLGIDGLRAVASAVDVPVIAIGGITPDNAATVCAAGAAGVAAIGAFMGSSAHGSRVIVLRDVVRAFREAFRLIR